MCTRFDSAVNSHTSTLKLVTTLPLTTHLHGTSIANNGHNLLSPDSKLYLMDASPLQTLALD